VHELLVRFSTCKLCGGPRGSKRTNTDKNAELIVTLIKVLDESILHLYPTPNGLTKNAKHERAEHEVDRSSERARECRTRK